MHIPDGFLDTKTWVTTALASSGAIAYAVKKTNKELDEKDAPLMGVLAAFIFAAQMLNFPVAGGTSGHFVGGALAAIMLGPWKAMLVMVSVVGIQALLFGDGGISALGANAFNMAILAPLTAYLVYGSLKRFGMPVAAFAAGMVSMLASAFAVSVELYFSGTAPFTITLALMLGWHILIGAGEGLITATAVGYLTKVRPDLIKGKTGLDFRAIAIFTAAAAILATFVSPLASSLPDGLERVAEDLGFIDKGTGLFEAWIPDYVVPGLKSEWLATGLAGLAGVLVAIMIGYGVANAVKRRSSRSSIGG